MTSAKEQIRDLIQLIKHESEVHFEGSEIYINEEKLLNFPDYVPLMKKLEFEKVINILQIPNASNLSDVDIELAQDDIPSASFKLYMSYKITLGPTFNDYFFDIIGVPDENLKPLTKDDIHLTIDSYVSRIGRLNVVPPSYTVHIAQQGSLKGKLNTKTDECKLMTKLFKNDTSLSKGISFHQAKGIHEEKGLKNNDLTHFDNLRTAINSKFKSVTKLKNLIKIKENRIRINQDYLLKP